MHALETPPLLGLLTLPLKPLSLPLPFHPLLASLHLLQQLLLEGEEVGDAWVLLELCTCRGTPSDCVKEGEGGESLLRTYSWNGLTF